MKFAFSPAFTALVLSIASVGLTPVSAHAEAAQLRTQAPGYYRVLLGEFEITALSDGTVKLPMTKLLHGKPEKISAQLKKNFLDDVVDTSVNAYLINTGSKLVLVDTGAAGLFGPTLGNVMANLRAAGYKPEQVDHVLITHMHPDHVGGLMADGKMAFPNATLHIDKNDVDFWLSKAKMDAAPADNKGFFQGAMASVNPYVEAGKLIAFQGNTELLPGIKAQASYGHTPGHTVYLIESKGQKLMLWGDLMHAAAVQFNDPGVTIAFDTDKKAARTQREKAYVDAVSQGYLVGATHLSFPGMGRLSKAPGGKSYQWIPVNYMGLK
jgi:glyoxylase-like metal-dependent hydrolase (beta-lactamase superfamily II)